MLKRRVLAYLGTETKHQVGSVGVGTGTQEKEREENKRTADMHQC